MGPQSPVTWTAMLVDKIYPIVLSDMLYANERYIPFLLIQNIFHNSNLNSNHKSKIFRGICFPLDLHNGG